MLWRRQRNVHWSTLSYQIELHELQHTARPKWRLIFVHEIWWGRSRSESIRNMHWTHLEGGNRRDVLKWFEDRQREMD